MRGRAAILFLSSLFLAAPLFPQCPLPTIYSGEYRASVLDVAVDGNDLWTATSYGVQLLDRSVDPPALVASLAVPGITRVVRAGGSTAYAGSGSSVAVIRKDGRSLQLVRTIDAGATVNDLLLTTNNLYAATANGLVQFDLLDPLNPARMATSFPTSSPNVTSLALGNNNSTLYAADGDNTVEQFSVVVPAVPQATGTISTLLRAKSVKVAGTRVYLSDGLRTDVVLGGTTASTLNFGSTSLASTPSDTIFAAGTDRHLRAVDLTLAAAPVDLYGTDIAPNGGTINRFSSLILTGGRLYAAAGDAGLLTFDVSRFAAPYPVRAYSAGGGTSSVQIVDGRAFVSRAAGGLGDYTIGSTGQLTQGRQWDTAPSRVQDGATGFLLTSSGQTITLWTLAVPIPAAISSATFRAAVQSAVLFGTTAYALLADNTLWSADLSLQNPTPSQVAVSGKPSFIARSGTAALLAELRDEGTTLLSYYPAANFSAEPRTAAVEGIATTSPALSGALAAVFTFRGITLVDFDGNTKSVLPGSTGALARALDFAGTSLLETTDSALLVWDTRTKTLTRRLALPAEPLGLDATDAFAVVPTGDGVTSIALLAQSQLPVPLPSDPGNAYYRKIVAGPTRIYLFDARGVDVFSIASAAPHFVAGVRAAGLIDVAASPAGFFTLGSNGTITAYSPDGVQLAKAALDEETDVQPLSIATAGGAVWVSIAKGCLTGGCEKKTIVLDPASLVRTATLTGAATDVVTSGTTAYALFDLPAEVRTINIADPLHPAPIAARATEGTQPPVSIAYSNGTVYVLGEKLYTYAAAGLAKTGEQLSAFQADPTGSVTYVDQRLRIDGNCLLITGRTFSPQQYTLQPFAPAQTLAMPAAAKSIATAGGRTYVLTDYSVEVLSPGPAPVPGRRRSK